MNDPPNLIEIYSNLKRSIYFTSKERMILMWEDKVSSLKSFFLSPFFFPLKAQEKSTYINNSRKSLVTPLSILLVLDYTCKSEIHSNLLYLTAFLSPIAHLQWLSPEQTGIKKLKPLKRKFSTLRSWGGLGVLKHKEPLLINLSDLSHWKQIQKYKWWVILFWCEI